ncbi:hypothetical protein CRUP_014144 [Coryphaenoides rupestris]|nr:hypothetical protein CRUP_014144 [Coryphaenoides rupestris]
MARLQQNTEDLKMASGEDTEEKMERNQLIDKQYNSDRQKLQKIRLLMARRNREIAILQRKMDEVPSRAELTQYQKSPHRDQPPTRTTRHPQTAHPAHPDEPTAQRAPKHQTNPRPPKHRTSATSPKQTAPSPN